MIHSYLNQLDRDYRAVVFINCNELPDWVLLNIPKHIKRMQYSVDDPWGGWMWKNRRTLYDLVLTNERVVAREHKDYPPVRYLPTAYDEHALPATRHSDQKYQSDVCFIGSLYPSRREILEKIMPLFGERIKFLGIGPAGETPVNAPIRAVWIEKVLPHSEYIKYILNSKICLHLNRDSQWQCDGVTDMKSITKTAESLCPRLYENAILGAFTITDSLRKEQSEIFKDSMPQYKDADDLKTLILYYLSHDCERKEHCEHAAKLAVGHSYDDRVKLMMRYIQETL
jgi:spore maturation protein CgeB